MASVKYNLARLRMRPGATAKQMAAEMNEFGLAPDEPYGVKFVTASAASGAGKGAVAGVLICREAKTISIEDRETGEIQSDIVQTAAEFPFNISTARETVEFHAGGHTIFERFAVFLTGCLQWRAQVDIIEVDLLAAVENLIKCAEAPKLIIRSARVSDFAANSYCNGVYTPKFISTDHGLEFMAEHPDDLQAVTVRWAGRSGRVGVTLGPKGCNVYSCDDDDRQAAQAVLKKLILTQ